MALGQIQQMIVNMSKMNVRFTEIAELYGERYSKKHPKTNKAIAVLTNLNLIERIPNVYPWAYRHVGVNKND